LTAFRRATTITLPTVASEEDEMRTPRHPGISIALALVLSVMLAVPAFAARNISYRGETSAPSWHRIRVGVFKKDDGRRFLQLITLRYTITCEDATTERWETIVFWGGRGQRLDESGAFSFVADAPDTYFSMSGDIGFGQASGAAEIITARLTDDQSDAQLCTTGALTWSAERTDSRPARALVPEGTGFMKVRVTDGAAEVVQLIQP
jgi:hypothetical protein